ncbi:Transposase [Piscirickettsia salmonis]|nr:helix-turn-helix domain-containing protein [Piscirickettsia salmonis]QGP54666.1 Transposase [Piscirickettsia salmonis]QGP64137.1 Transposase [Piscirickettsia salmonis]
MPSPYSYDLRIRALKMIDEGIPITQVSKLLKISRDTLHRWKNRRDHTGDVKARFGYQTGYNHKISDMEEFQKFRKRRYLGRYFAHPMMQNRRAKRDDYKPSAVRVTQRYVP